MLRPRTVGDMPRARSTVETYTTRFARPRGRLLGVLALVAIVGVGGDVSPAQANPCTKQCRSLQQVCRLPFKIVFQAQKAGCTGVGKRQCIAAAKFMYAAGRLLCRSVATNCRKRCKMNGVPGDLQCGDGIVDPTEDCDPPGWASCTGGAACGADCLCSTTTSTTLPPP